MAYFDFLKAFFVGLETKSRRDLNNVFNEAFSDLMRAKLPKSVKRKIEEISTVKSELIRQKLLEDFLSKEDVKIVYENKKIKLNEFFGLLYDHRMYNISPRDLDLINDKAERLRNTDGALLKDIFELCVKDWIRLGENHCLTMKIGKFNKDLDIYCLINGEPGNLDEVTIFIKVANDPCEFTSMRELLSFENNNHVTDLFMSTVNSHLKKERSKTVSNLLKLISAKEHDYKSVVNEEDVFSVLSVGFNDKIMNDLEHIFELTAEYSIFLLKEHLGFRKKKISLYSHLVYFLVSKALSNVALSINVSNLDSFPEIKTGFIDYLRSLF